MTHFTLTKIQGRHLVCDNLSLVNNVNHTQQSNSEPNSSTAHADHGDPDTSILYANYSNQTMVLDWDVLTMIEQTLNNHLCSLDIAHIKGHQDDEELYESLSLLAQLNVDADKIAKQYQHKHGQPCTKVPRLPSNAVQFHLQGKHTITYKLKPTLYYQATGPELKLYIANKYGWDKDNVERVDWKAHRAAINRTGISKTHITKLVHNILPTNDRVHKFNQIQPEKCPYCQVSVEDRDHVICCRNPECNKQRTALKESLSKMLERLHTDPILHEILISGLTAWFDGKPLKPSNYPEEYRQLILQQNRLKWRQLFNGRMSKEWCRLQHQHLAEKHLASNKLTGHLWCVSVINALWIAWYDMWTSQNKKVHGQDATTCNQADRQQAIAKLEYYYSRKNDLLPVDRNYFEDSLQCHTEKPTRSIINWLNTYRGLFKFSMKEAKKRAIQNTHSI